MSPVEEMTATLQAPKKLGASSSSAWRMVKLSEVCIKISDGTHHSPPVQHSEPGKGRFKYVTSKNIRPWGLDLGNIAYVDENVHREIYSRCQPEVNDVLLTKDGANTGNVAINTLEEEFSLLSSVALLKPKRDVLESRFLRYYIESPIGSKRLLGEMTGTAIRRIILKKIKDTEIPLPPLDEQKQIVAEIEKQFTRLEAGVTALKRVQANLKRYRATVLKAACEGKLVPTEAELQRSDGRDQKSGDRKQKTYETGEQLLQRILTERRKNWSGRGKYKEPVTPDAANLPKLPEGWAWATLDALAEIKGGITKDQKRKFIAPSRSVPYLRVANVQRGYIDLTEVKEIVTTEEEIKELTLKPGDMLFNEGGDRDKLGRGWVWSDELSECIHQNHVFRARSYIDDLNPKLVSWYANTFGQKFFFDEGKHTTNLASISMTKLKGLPVPIPPPSEQKRIVEEVERRLSVIDELESVVKSNLQRATRLHQSILKKAFTGELTAKD